MTDGRPQAEVLRASFHPDSDAGILQQMREAFVARRRQQALDVLPQLPVFPKRLLALLEKDSDASTMVLDDPVFAIWLRYFYRAWAKGWSDEVALHAGKLPAVFQDVERRLNGDAESYVPGTVIAMERFRVHPYVKAATPPSYDFADLPDPDAEGPAIGHPLALQTELIGLALDNIGEAWPEMREQVLEYVRIFGYLPDATFRSCSAARYSGIVYLGNMDESILDIEESIVHETGHQVLYRVGELERITVPDAPLEANYELPWSGSRRDLFGFVHAYYIYALLVKYFWRRSKHAGRQAMECQQRAALILAGSLKATPMLIDDPDLAPQGKAIVEAIAADLEKLRVEIQAGIAPTPAPPYRPSSPSPTGAAQ